MGRVLDPLKRMGLNIDEEGRNTLPLTLHGTSNLVPVAYRQIAATRNAGARVACGLISKGADQWF